MVKKFIEIRSLALSRVVLLSIFFLCIAAKIMGQQVSFERVYSIQPHTYISCISQKDTNLMMFAGTDLVQTNLVGDNAVVRGKNMASNDVISVSDGLIYAGRKFLPASFMSVLKVDMNSNTIWERQYGSGNNNQIMSIAACQDNGFVFGGNNMGGIWRCDSLGDTLWTFIDPFLVWDIYSIIETADKSIVATGGFGLQPGGQGKSILKLDSVGNLLWDTILWPSSPSSFSLFLGVVEVDSIYVACGVSTNDTLNMVGFSGSGTVLWSHENVYATKAIKYDDSSFICVDGQTTSSCWDYIVVSRWHSDGTLIWQNCYPGLGNFGVEIHDVEVSDDKCIYLVGNQRLSSSGLPWRMYLMKLDSMGILTDVSFPVADQLSAVHVYPIPASDHITLSILLDVNNFNDIHIDIVSMLGQKLIRVNNVQDQNLRINISSLSSGIYLYRVYHNAEVLGAGRFIVD